jgi:apolipoprotein D and lipocalin family protein
MKCIRSFTLLTLIAVLAVGCASTRKTDPEPVRTVAQVDLQRYVGDWFVIAHIPNIRDTRATRAKESYSLDPQGRVNMTYSYFVDSPAGEQRVFRAVGTVRNVLTFAEWLVQWSNNWPVQDQYLIIYLDDSYQVAVVSNNNRRNLRILSRTPTIDPVLYSNLIMFLQERDFDVSVIRLVPQS